jgi:hypothetical protein
VGPRASLDRGKSRSTGIRSPDRPARSQANLNLVLDDNYLQNTAILYEHVDVIPRHKSDICIYTDFIYKYTRN